MNKKYIAILVLILFVQTMFFIDITRHKDDYKLLEKEANEFFEEYKASPEKFTVTEAKVIGLYAPEQSVPGAGSDNSYITVEFTLPDGTVMTSAVLEDYKKNKQGDTIEIAYRFGNDDARTSTLRITQTHYVENGRAYDRIKMYQLADIALAVIITLLMLKKIKE